MKKMLLGAVLSAIVMLISVDAAAQEKRNGRYYFEQVIECPTLNSNQIIGSLNQLAGRRSDAVKSIVSSSTPAGMISICFSYILKRDKMMGDILVDVVVDFYAKDGKLRFSATDLKGRVANLTGKGETYFYVEDLKYLQKEEGVESMKNVMNTIFGMVGVQIENTVAEFNF